MSLKYEPSSEPVSPQLCLTRVDCQTIHSEREFFIDNQLVRIHFIIVMIRWTGLAPWEFEFPFLGSRTSTVTPSGGVGKSSFSVALICTTRLRIPASASANQESAKGDARLSVRICPRTGPPRSVTSHLCDIRYLGCRGTALIRKRAPP